VDTVRSATRQRNMESLGSRHEVLVERQAKRGEAMLMARTRDFKTVLIPGDESMLGQYFTVELTGTTGSTFTGSIVRERQPLPMAG
jgi:tRNA-2-methylthio-N6-dimethylallyladenosine synthase